MNTKLRKTTTKSLLLTLERKKKNPKPRIEITVLNNSSENETDTFYIIISTLNIHLASNGDLGSIKRGRLWSSSYLVQYEVKT